MYKKILYSLLFIIIVGQSGMLYEFNKKNQALKDRIDILEKSLAIHKDEIQQLKDNLDSQSDKYEELRRSISPQLK